MPFSIYLGTYILIFGILSFTVLEVEQNILDFKTPKPSKKGFIFRLSVINYNYNST